MSQDIDNRFDYHEPDDGKAVKHNNVRELTKLVAENFDTLLPEGREKSLAITKLEEATFWANASIARNN